MCKFASKFSATFRLGNDAGAAHSAAMGAVILPSMVHIPQAQQPREDNTAIQIHLSKPNAFMFCI
jgi:hypothetical protein